MRILGGTFAGRELTPPGDARVRPTAEPVRGALLDALAADLPGARVLDLFAGTGALGLEALSRGAARVEFVELNPPSLAALRANIAALAVAGRAVVHRGDARRFAERLPPAAFDLAFADPPYARDDAGDLVHLFRQTPFARILAVEHPARTAVAGDETRRYGDTAITFCYAP